jgi:transcriptional regulator with GAF, ATPase, and Fis domain
MPDSWFVANFLAAHRYCVLISAAPGINTMSDDRRGRSESTCSALFSFDGAENHGMIGNSAPMLALFAALPRIATSSAPLLVGGERGTGKDLIARAVHALSERASGPCVTVDCTAEPGRRVQASLRAGLQAAAGGTVILDGIDRLSIDQQARLLRTLRSEAIDVTGSGRRRFELRVISTFSSDLESAVEQGRFREALYYRMNGVVIKVPPLRERGTDVQLLADYFLDRFTTPGLAGGSWGSRRRRGSRCSNGAGRETYVNCSAASGRRSSCASGGRCAGVTSIWTVADRIDAP